jgi:hypothetical protein
MTEEDAKEAVKTEKRKRGGEDDTELTEWRARLEDKVLENGEALRRIETMLKLGLAKMLERMQALEDSLDWDPEPEGKKEKGKGKAVDVEESTEESDSEKETEKKDGDAEMQEEEEVGVTVGGEDGVEGGGDGVDDVVME